MTISNALNRKTFAGNGVTTSFDTSPVIFYLSSDLQVRVVTDATGAEIILAENTNYTVSGGAGSAGTINLAAGASPFGAPAAGTTLVILRIMAITQETDLVNNDSSDAEVAERTIDRLTLLAEQMREVAFGRSVRFPAAEGLNGVLPALASRAGKFLGFDASTGALVMAAALSAVFSSAVVGQIPFGITGGTFGQSAGLSYNSATATLTVGSGVITALVSNPSGALSLASSATILQINASGHLVDLGGDNLHDIGIGGDRFRTGQFGTSVVTPLYTSAVTVLVRTPSNANDANNRIDFKNSVSAANISFAIRGGADELIQIGPQNVTGLTSVTMGWGAFQPSGGLFQSTATGAIIDSGSTGSVLLKTNNGTTTLEVAHLASAVNFLYLQGAVTTGSPVIAARGSDTNIPLLISGQGTGSLNLSTGLVVGSANAVLQLQVIHTASATRNITVTGSNGGNPTLSVTAGNLAITPTVAIAGSVLVGTNPSSSGAVNLAYATGLYTRNSANNNDLNLIASATQNSVVDIVSIGIAGSTVGVMWKARSGGAAPTTSDLPAGAATVWRDTGGATTKLYYNNAGAIQSVALA